MLPRPLGEIASRAKHLAIVRRCMPALRPGLDVVCVHLVDAELLSAHLAHPTLSCVGCELLRFRECTCRQALFALAKHLGDDATLLRHIVVHEELGDLLLNRLCVKNLAPILLVESSPIDALEYLHSVLGMDECRLNPTYD